MTSNKSSHHESKKRVLKILILGLFIAFLPIKSFSNPVCSKELISISQLNELKFGADIAKRVNAWKELDSLKASFAKEIFKNYLESGFVTKNLSNCLSKEDLEDIESLTAHYAYELSLDFLSQQGGALKKFADSVRSKNLSSFRVAGIGGWENPTGKKGGFHSGRRSIFLDFSKVPREEWFVIFIHEMAHGLDDYLYESVSYFQNQEILDQTSLVLKSYSKNNVLDTPKDIQDFVSKRTRHELDRAYYSEYRAWALTVALYEEGLEKKIFDSIDWMEKMRSPNMSIEESVFRYLDTRFTDELKNNYRGVFIFPLFYSELLRQRELARQSRPQLPKTYLEILN